MKFEKQWTIVTRYMFHDPDVFFLRYSATHGIGYALQFLILTYTVALLPLVLLVAGVNAAAATAVVTVPEQLEPLLVSTPVEALVIATGVVGLGTLLWLLTVAEALVVHVFAFVLGARGIVGTLEAYAFPSVVRFGLWWFPVANVGFGFYGWCLQVKGLTIFHDLSIGKAAIAALFGLLVYVPLLLVGASVAGVAVPGIGDALGPVPTLPYSPW